MVPNKESIQPLYIQIREDLRGSIARRELKPGDRLPPVTGLASQRSVTAATIRRALQDLIAEGLITSHVGRGTFVADNDRDSPKNAPESDFRPRPDAPIPEKARRWRASQALTRSLNEMMALAKRPGVIAFSRGIGDPGTLDKGILTRLATEALSGGEEVFWDSGDPKGLLSLRKAIARLYREQGLEVSPEQVLVTSGSQQAVSLIAQQAAENGLPVFCETPCYAGVTNAFCAFGNPPETVMRDGDGPITAELPEGEGAEGSIFYLCPVLHNPMGTDISAERREAVASWARRNGALIVSDEVFRDLHFDVAAEATTENLPGTSGPLSFLRDPGPDRSIILGSLSKSFISGLRVGWIVSSEERVKSLATIKKTMDLGCPPLMQGIARAFLENTEGYEAHRRRIRGHYRTLRDATLSALERYMPEGVSWSRPSGGFQLWVTLPEGLSSVALFLKCVDNGVAFIPGPLQDINNRFMNSFRLCYGSLKPQEIEEGVRRLGESTAAFLADGPADGGASGIGDY